MPSQTHEEIKFSDFLRPHTRRIVFLILLTAALSILTMLPPLLIRAIIDRVITEGQRNLFLILGFCMIAVPLAVALLRYLQTVGIAHLAQRFILDLRYRLYNHLLNMSQRFYSHHSAGKLVNRVMGDTGIVQRALTARSFGIISDFVAAAFAVSAVFLINWRIALLVLLIVIGFVVNYRLSIQKIIRATRGYRASMDRLSGGVQNRLLGNQAVKTFGTEDREQEEFTGEAYTSMALTTEASVRAARFSMNSKLLQQMGRMTVFFVGCYFVLHEQMSYGDVVAFTAYTMQLLNPAVRFSELVRTFQDVRIALDRIFEIFHAEPEITNPPDPVYIDEINGDVEFCQVDFHYSPEAPVLRDFSLQVPAGSTVALIGPTGCGKSTILNLLMRFYDVVSGEIKIDNQDVRKYDLQSLRRQFGVVLQEPLLFDISIADNIRYSRPSASQADIETAARAAEIHDYILSLPHGYQTIIGSEGIEMSLGQKQRITIARAIAADPAVLIMDEATSALDSESERAIQKAMERILQGRTSFIVAHRLSTIRNADLIVLLREGQIDEMGSHEELMAQENGRYRQLYEKFMGKGIISDDDEEEAG